MSARNPDVLLRSRKGPIDDARLSEQRSIGRVFVERGLLTSDAAERISRYATENTMEFGAAAIELNLLTAEEVRSAFAGATGQAAPSSRGVAWDVIAAHSPRDPVVEPVRTLRSLLNLQWTHAVPRKVVFVTSPDRGDGRSWVAANLATAFAQFGERTLLIDADLRHPSQHELFNLDRSTGLSSMLSARVGADAAVQIHPRLSLYVLPAGEIPPNPQELLGRFDVVMDYCADEFDVVVVDTPAMSEAADAQVIAAHAYCAVMVIRKNHTRQTTLSAAIRALGQTGIRIAGAVLTEH